MADDILIPDDPIELIPDDGLIIAGNNTPERRSISEQLSETLTTSHRLFIVAGVMDLTNFIVVPSYQVNMMDGYEEWTDNNKVTHRDTVSQKAKGSFQLKFETLEQFQSFMIVMKDYKKQNGAYDCSVYCVNRLDTFNIEMFIDFDPPNVMPYIGAKDYDPIDVNVEQRGNQYVRSV